MEIVSTMGSGNLGRELDLDALIESLESEFDIETNRHSHSDEIAEKVIDHLQQELIDLAT